MCKCNYILREMAPHQIGPPQPESRFVGPCGPTSMYDLRLIGPSTPKALRNIAKMIEIQADVLDDLAE